MLASHLKPTRPCASTVDQLQACMEDFPAVHGKEGDVGWRWMDEQVGVKPITAMGGVDALEVTCCSDQPVWA